MIDRGQHLEWQLLGVGAQERWGLQGTEKVIPEAVADNYLVENHPCHMLSGFIEGINVDALRKNELTTRIARRLHYCPPTLS